MIHITFEPEYDFDAVIIGAGPAGARCAIELHKAGQNVLLVDRKQFPRDKVCGDFLSPVTLLELKQLGITELAEFKESNKIHWAGVHYDGKELITRSLPHTPDLPHNGRVIPRMILDNLLVETAKKRGITILENHKFLSFERDLQSIRIHLQSTEGVKTICSKLLVGADGSNSAVRRQLRSQDVPAKDRILAVRAYYEGVEGPADRADLYFSSKSFPGYCWLFPTAKDKANVGVGMVLETLPPTEEHLRDLLFELIETDAALNKRLNKARLVGKVVGWPLTTYNPNAPIVDDRVVLIGDAAGLINPLNGEGIQYALLSARWLAENVTENFNSGDFSESALQSYVKKVEKELRYDMALADLIVHLIRNRSLNQVWLRSLQIIVARARLDDEYAQLAGGVLAGLLPASKVVNPKFILNTIEQAAMSLGVETVVSTFKGPQHLAQLSLSPVKLGVQFAAQTWQNPIGTAKWGVELLNEVSEFVVQAGKNLFN